MHGDDEARAYLERTLLGVSIHNVFIGSWWGLQFASGVWLVCQELVAPEEAEINALLERASTPVLDAVDPEQIAKSAAVLRNLRRPVTSVAIEDDASLHLWFDRGGELRIPTDATIVDWQWCLNASGADPYRDFDIACFWSGAIEMKAAIRTARTPR